MLKDNYIRIFNKEISVKFKPITLALLIFILLTIFSLSIISAYSRSAPAYTFGYQTTPFTGGQLFPAFDRNLCGAGQDFILQVDPLGCTPSPVRSDLLEEQEVMVLCPIYATQLNPLIEVDNINYMTISSRNLPKEVLTVGYYPARAALGKWGNDIATPVFDNVGYATIVLRRQPNESAMPDFVEGNLTATMRYNIHNAFGTGRTVYYLPQLTEEEWDRDYRAYGFWDGRGYLRLMGADAEGASIAIYSDRDVSGTGRIGEKTKISTLNLEKGGKPQGVFLPGFNYCLGGINAKLVGLENPDTRTRLRINSDVLEVAQGEKFLENKCIVKSIEKRGINQRVRISCSEDEGKKDFSLAISPKVNLSVNSIQKEYEVGERLDENKTHSLYLGFIGNNGTTNSANDLYIRLVLMPKDRGGTRERLGDGDISSVFGIDRGLMGSDVRKGVAEETTDALKSIGARLSILIKRFVEGKRFGYLHSLAPGEEVFGMTEIDIMGYAGVVDVPLDLAPKEVRENYTRAIEDYESIKESFADERYPSQDLITLGEKALKEAIVLAGELGQRSTALQLCQEFSESYDSVAPAICNDEYLLYNTNISSQGVLINGRTHLVSFEGIKEPKFEEFGLEIVVSYPDKDDETFNLTKNEVLYLDDSTDNEEYIQLLDLSEDSVTLKNSATLKTNLIAVSGERLKAVLKTPTQKLNIGTEETFNSKYSFSIKEIYLQKVAKVTLDPQIDYAKTNATFSFKIGIEKRGIQLSPEKTTEKILALNGTIEKWTKISDNLGKVVSTGKLACGVTAGALTFYNFFSNLGGKAIARQKAMRGEGGWYDICQKAVNAAGSPYKDIEACLLDNSDEIGASVNAYQKVMDEQNQQQKQLQEGISTTRFLGEKIVNTDALAERFINDDLREEIQGNIGRLVTTITVAGKPVAVSEIISNINSNTTSVTQARDLQLNSRLLGSAGTDSNTKSIARKQTEKVLGEIYGNYQADIQKISAANEFRNLGIGDWDVFVSGNQIVSYYRGEKTKQAIGSDAGLQADVPVKGIIFNNKRYLVQLKSVGTNTYRIVDVFDEFGESVSKTEADEINRRFRFESVNPNAYKNKYNDPLARYYETEPYKGLPSVVPFDLQDGWYAAVKSTLPILGGLRAYDDSGRVSSFYVCNVGANGREEFVGGDDICRGFVPKTGAALDFPGLDERGSLAIMNKATRAIEDATTQYKSGVSQITINNQRIKVGEPAADIPNIQCGDFMSPSDCNLMFNVCDPFVCPSSRCDLGGNYPVKDVVQSGIIGSLALCLPNFPEVKIPICVSGVHAGVEGWVSVLRSYEQCLQTSLDTGSTVGICDEINSVYMCEFVWRQGLPVVKYGAPRILAGILGQNTRGGGEYLGFQSALDNAGKSFDYFTQYYADDSFRAFKARSADQVGSELCRRYPSFVGPEGGNLLDAFTAPDSPTQFYGRFEEIPYTTATNPPASQYKVFYHIYAGKDFPAYYQVYLRGTGSSFFQDTGFRRPVASGFIKTGDFKTETKDFTAPSGYKELCIVVNGQEECGFKQVTTEFGINYITEKYVADEAKRTDISSEAECVSGSPNAFSLLNPSLLSGEAQGIVPGISDAANPAIYNRGIIRVCSTNNPGQNTDGAAGTEASRWKEVGYCDTQNVKCWLDTASVKDVIKNAYTEEQILGEVENKYLEALKKEGQIMDNSQFSSFDKYLKENEGKNQKIIDAISANISKVFNNNQRAYLLWKRGLSYGELAKIGYKAFINKQKTEMPKEPETAQTQTKTEEEPEEETPTTSLTCTDKENCQKTLGQKIIELAKKKKESTTKTQSISTDAFDSRIKADTGAENFECLVLQVAYHESIGLNHCGRVENGVVVDSQKNGKPLYCEGNLNEVLKSATAGEESLGIMQVNKNVHGEKLFFEENVNTGIDVLIDGENSSLRIFKCTGKSYSGWLRALRNYNGWGCTGNNRYVEDVINSKDEIARLFPDECGISSEIQTGAQTTNCGNGVIESGEDCDGNNLGSFTCSNLGFARGVLRCTSDCKIDTSQCPTAV